MQVLVRDKEDNSLAVYEVEKIFWMKNLYPEKPKSMAMQGVYAATIENSVGKNELYFEGISKDVWNDKILYAFATGKLDITDVECIIDPDN